MGYRKYDFKGGNGPPQAENFQVLGAQKQGHKPISESLRGTKIGAQADSEGLRGTKTGAQTDF